MHFELIVSARLPIGVGAPRAVDVGQAVDVAFDVHAFFETLLGSVGLVEGLSSLNVVAVETDELTLRSEGFDKKER